MLGKLPVLISSIDFLANYNKAIPLIYFPNNFLFFIFE